MRAYVALGLGIPPTQEEPFPHITLIPPFNLQDSDLVGLTTGLRSISLGSIPQTVTLGRLEVLGTKENPTRARLVEDPIQISALAELRLELANLIVQSIPNFHMDSIYDFNPHCSMVAPAGDYSVNGLFLKPKDDSAILCWPY